MNNALLAGVGGLRAHQTMLDVAGNNLANVNTTAFKSSRVSFAELLGNTLRPPSQPTESIGGTNPQQVGSGVTVSSVDRIMDQGSITNTGQPLDVAMEGAGYFVLSDGNKEIYTRVGSFAVDSDYYLVDPGTGYRVQRIGSEGESDGFQDVSSNSIRIPYDVALPAQATEQINYTGNLSADAYEPTTNALSSGLSYTKDGAAVAEEMRLDELDQTTGLTATDTITLTGTKRDGTEINGGAGLVIDLHDGADYITVGEMLDQITQAYQIGGEDVSVARVENGQIRLTDANSGYSLTDIRLEYNGGGSFDLPKNFEIATAGGQAAWNTNVEVFDSQGIAHTLSASFVRTDDNNTWDCVLTAMTGDVEMVDRRIRGITFLADGSYGGLNSADEVGFQVRFAHDPSNTRTLRTNLGTIGQFNGLSQFGGSSTVAPSGQDGYASGWLSSLSVTREGVLVGVFTNGIRRDVAAMRLATFQNPAGLESIGNNYFVTSSNSGDSVPTKGLSGGAGAVRGGALEKSNVEVAKEFVNMITAQNGFQANARTIRVANEMLRELTNLIR